MLAMYNLAAGGGTRCVLAMYGLAARGGDQVRAAWPGVWPGVSMA